MNSETIFRTMFYILLGGTLFIRSYYGRQARQATGRGMFAVSPEAVEREGRLSVTVRGVSALALGVWAVLFVLNPPWMDWTHLPLPGWLRWLGAVVGVVSLALLAWVQATLGRFWSTNLQLTEDHQLVTGGPYRWVRHPMYSALFLFFVGGSLLAADLILLGLTVIALVVLSRRVPAEEAMMVERFGDAYREYAARTGRSLPRLWG